MPRERRKIPGVDPKLLIKDAAKLLPDPSRRLFLRGAASLGALATLTGCDIIDGPTAESALRVVSHFNDWVQARLFSETTLATEYPESAITRPFPFNAYYAEDEAPEVDGESYQLEIGGLVDNKKSWTLAELYKLPEVSQITRHVCVEGWSAIGSWQGVKAVRLSQDDRRRHQSQICLVPMRRRLFQHHRHADRAASADATDAQIRSPDPAARLRLPDQDPHPHQARLQEPKYVTAMLQKTRRPACSARRRWQPNIPKAPSRDRSRSTPIMPRTRRPRSTARPISSRSAAWSTTRNRGRWPSSTSCRKCRRSPAMSASRAGARSARGRA